MSNKRNDLKLDETDLRLLSRLQTDARISNVALAECAHLSPAPSLRRVRELGGFAAVTYGYKQFMIAVEYMMK